MTELRAGIVVGPGSAAFEVMRDMVYNLPVLTPPRWVRSKSSPVALENLLVYLADLLAHRGRNTASSTLPGRSTSAIRICSNALSPSAASGAG